MRQPWKRFGGIVFAAMAMGAASATSALAQSEESVLSISATSAMTTQNPYAESASQMYSLWCQVYGCLGRYNYLSKQFEGILAESWENIDDRTWRFTLRDDLVRHDGGPAPTAADVVHSWQQALNDPDSVQAFYFSEVEKIEAIDERTVDVVTKEPLAPLLSYLFDRFPISSKELHEKHGASVYNEAPYGWGPYSLDEFAIDNRIVVRRHDQWPAMPEAAPEVAVFQQMREPEQRVTAVLNGEIQIARLIPPQLVSRLEGREDIEVVQTGSIEPMFLAMNPNFEPWGDVRVRRAAAFAIDRDLIIERLLFGYADRLDGPLGTEQICYSGAPDEPITYDPEKAKALLAEAGFADGGPKVELYVPNGRYISDRQIGEVLGQMLGAVGFDVTVHIPEWANLWSQIRGGDVPTFYMGRGLMLDPSEPLAQYFQTGVSPRIGYSNPELDALFAKERETFDPEERCKIFREISQLLVDEVPAHFLWNHRLVNAVHGSVEWPADASGEVWLAGVKMK